MSSIKHKHPIIFLRTFFFKHSPIVRSTFIHCNPETDPLILRINPFVPGFYFSSNFEI